MQWKMFVNTAEASNKMILEHANSMFGDIVAVDTGQDKLKVNVLAGHELLQWFGAFIVQALQLGV